MFVLSYQNNKKKNIALDISDFLIYCPKTNEKTCKQIERSRGLLKITNNNIAMSNNIQNMQWFERTKKLLPW